MPIGDQEFGGQKVTSFELKKRYDDLIKEALLKADPRLEITRADDVAIPGTITSDILTRIMHSDVVVADVTYPNPNVFYELGLRHSCRVGTIIIRDKNGPRAPFDIAHLRHLEYENTPSGLKSLSDNLKQVLSHFERNPNTPDCQFQELAKLTQYAYPDYIDRSNEVEPEAVAFMAMMQSPEILAMLVRSASGEQLDQGELIAAMVKDPVVTGSMVQALVKSGQLSFGNSSQATPAKPPQRLTKKSTPKRRK
jgi:hypothetical protein